MKLTLKDILKLVGMIAPYIVAIGTCAGVYAAGQKAHSTASVPGLDEGDWYIPSIDEEYEIFSAMKTDGSDPVNAAFVAAGSSARSLSVARLVPARNSSTLAWLFSYGYFNYSYFSNAFRACCVALLDLES